MPQPLRDTPASGIFGRPRLSAADQQKVEVGNQLAHFSSRLLKVAIAHGVPTVLENLISSMLWHCSGIQKQCEKSLKTVYDACQFGELWRTRTRLVSWNIDVIAVGHRCVLVAPGLCSVTNLPHEMLAGLRSSKEWNTALASAYPRPLCDAVVGLVCAESGMPTPLHERPSALVHMRLATDRLN